MDTRRARQRGQSLPEFLIVVPLFLFLVLLLFQLMLIYRAKTVLDYAALEAARRGAVSQIDMGEMQRGLAYGLAPLYATESGATSSVRAYGEAYLDITLRGNAQIQVVSPTRAAWDSFNEPQYNGRRALPNDNLAYRSRDDRGTGTSVQDANILKIRVDYDFPLIVPFVDLVLRGESRFVRPDGWFDDANVEMKHPLLGLGRHYRIPLQAHAVVRLQSPVYDRNRLAASSGP